MQFYEATGLSDEVIHRAQKKIRKRVLSLFVRRGLLSSDEAQQMQTWQNGGGFSLNAEVRIEGEERQGLERLFRYCARPIFSGERLCWQDKDEMLIYRLRSPRHDGQTLVRLTPAEFLDRVATLMPPPRRHRHRYHGVLAPNALLREQVTSRAGLPVTSESVVSADKPKTGESEEPAAGCPFASIWAMLLARIYEINPLVCPRCGGEMRIIALT